MSPYLRSVVGEKREMNRDLGTTFHAVVKWCQAHGIVVTEGALPPEKAGEFTGRRVLMNREFSSQDRIFYLTHAVGSIVIWSRDNRDVQQMFTELREAKKDRESQPNRLKQAIDRYRAFEIHSSELAIGLLHECQCSDLIGPYTNFMRADLEAMTEFHRTGKAPVWRDFFSRWNEDVAAGRRHLEPFQVQPIPEFEPVEFEKQEILQR